MDNPVGRELKVSELKPPQVVVLWKEGSSSMFTMWVAHILPDMVYFQANGSKRKITFGVTRTGKDMESITDDSGAPMKIYEYLGEV